MEKLLPVTKVASDYSEEELTRLREEFVPVAEKIRQRRKFILLFIIACVIWNVLCLFCIIPAILQILPPNVQEFVQEALRHRGRRNPVGMILNLPLFVLFGVIESRFKNQIKCPACHNHLYAPRLGDYCPECGNSHLDKSSRRLGPKCEDCGKRLTRYKIRACTHCGVFLDEKGF
jgi:hypothetical protein